MKRRKKFIVLCARKYEEIGDEFEIEDTNFYSHMQNYIYAIELGYFIGQKYFLFQNIQRRRFDSFRKMFRVQSLFG